MEFNNKKYTWFTFWVSKDNVIIWKNYNLLIRVGNYKLWIKDKYVYTNQFVNYVSLGIANEFKYSVFDENNKDKEINGSELIEMLKKIDLKYKK